MDKSTSSGPVGAGPTGLTGETATSGNKIAIFSKQLNTLMGLCSTIIKSYIENESYAVTYKDMNLHDDTDVKLDVLLKEHNKYIESFGVTSDEAKVYKLYLGSFNKILSENDNVLMQAINNDSWIRKVNPASKLPLQLMFGDVLGKSSTICCRLGMIYKMALVMKATQEKKMKEYPELFKADEKTTHSNNLLLNCFKIFTLTDKANDPEVKKTLGVIINELSNKLGLNTRQGFDLTSMFDSASPLVSVGVDMLNKHVEASAAKEGKAAKKIEPKQLTNIFSKVFNGNNIQQMMSEFKNNASNGPPDIGKILGTMMQGLNTSEIMDDLKKATESEIPEMAENNKSKQNESQNNNEKSSEVEEEVEIIEDEEVEIIEESDLPSSEK